MSKLIKKVEQIDKGWKKQTKIDISRQDKKMSITPKDVKQMVKEAYNKVKAQTNNFRIFVRTFNPTRPYTFNVDGEGEIERYEDIDTYFEGTVKVEKKFISSGRVQIYVETYKNKKPQNMFK